MVQGLSAAAAVERESRLTRMDMHCHSRASRKPVIRALGAIGMPECYSPPEKVYDQARARGMDLVTITDHDTIDGAMELVERGFEGFVVGEEVSVVFPEDRCLLHVLVWGLSAAQHEEIGSLGLRDDVYAFAQWLSDNALPHSLAHPLYVQNGRLTAWHLERCALLFKGWEVLNGAHSGSHRSVIERYLGALKPRRVQELSRRHEIEPLWSRIWQKGITAGSDDHGLLNIGRTWTGVEGEGGRKIADAGEFLRRVTVGHAEVGGVAGHASLLAHQLATVGAHYYGDRIHERLSPRQRHIGSKLARFAGVEAPRPAKAALLLDEAKRRLSGKKKSLPVLEALRGSIGPLLERYPDLTGALDPSSWDDGAPIAQHDRMESFTDDLTSAMNAFMASGAVRAVRERDKAGIVDHLISYLIVHAAQAPYLFSLFHQNKERHMLDRLEHEAAEPGSGVSVLERPMRVCLFTDTLGDVNGVSRFIQNVAHQANETGRELQVITSTSFECPAWRNIHNFKPVFSTKMPKYEQLELALPPLKRMLSHTERLRPDVIHISTPGPVGLVGFLAARQQRVPVLGVYHTDFPAYVERLFEDHTFTSMTSLFMRLFYGPFRSVFTRSADYMDALETLGLPRKKMVRLMPGLETKRFNTSFCDPSVWRKIEREPGSGCAGLSRDSVRVLYVGRVSVEKNLPMLTAVWERVEERCREAGKAADLVVVGDGPYRKTMEEALRGKRCHFLGFRHGDELSAIYASADVFAFPSTTDTLGQVVMESQASGLPVIVTDEGGPKEVVEHGRTGFVLPADERPAWVETLSELILDDAKRERMGREAAASMQAFDIRHSFEHFWEVHTEAWHEHLASIGIVPKGVPSAECRVPRARRNGVLGAEC